MTELLTVDRPGWTKTDYSEEETWVRQELAQYSGVWERWEHTNGGAVNINTGVNPPHRIVAVRPEGSDLILKVYGPLDKKSLELAFGWAEHRN